jgi:hypothetical protein
MTQRAHAAVDKPLAGFPITWGNLLFTGNLEDIALPPAQRSIDRWFNTDAGFNKVSSQQLVANVRTFPLRVDSVRTDAINNLDLSVIKNVSFGNGRMVQLRVEAINALNHPRFPGPNTNPTQVAFGRISASSQLNYARRGQVTVRIVF